MRETRGTVKGGRKRIKQGENRPGGLSSNKDDDGAQSGRVRLRSDPDQILKSSARTDDSEGIPSRHASRASKLLPQVNPHCRIRGSSSPGKKSSPSLSRCLYPIAGGMSTDAGRGPGATPSSTNAVSCAGLLRGFINEQRELRRSLSFLTSRVSRL